MRVGYERGIGGSCSIYSMHGLENPISPKIISASKSQRKVGFL